MDGLKKMNKVPCSGWRVVQTKAHEEVRVAHRLNRSNVDVYVPMIQKKSYTFGKLMQRVQPLFPQYVFARFDIEEAYSKLRWTVGVKRLVVFNGRPALVKDEVINFIKHQENAKGIISQKRSFRPNQKVLVQFGVLKDIEGLFVKELSGPDRVLVLMTIMGAATHVQVDSAMLKPV